jgi:hypothetical protein
MRYEIDITDEQFENIDFSESVIMVSCPRVLPNIIIFNVWGIVIRKIGIYKPKILERSFVNSYISGFSQITIENVVGGELNVQLYEPDIMPRKFAHLQNGDEITLKRKWEYENSNNLYNYDMYCVLEWPLGYCYFSLVAQGKAKLEFNLEDCVSIAEYIKDPNTYGFKSS